MGIEALSLVPLNRGAILLDNTTDVPLPIQLFNDLEAAEHFLIWSEREEREPYGPAEHYLPLDLAESVKDWAGEFTDEDGELTAEAYAEWEAAQS